jgi:hypothetical protein
LLAAAGSAQISAMSYDQLLASFNGTGLVLGHDHSCVGSALVGLLYGVALPMFPRRPILLGGILAPLFWSGILYAEMGIINPALQQRIDWKWFMASQFAFGLVAGFVVARHERISTMQHLPFAVRAGFEAPGIILARRKAEGNRSHEHALFIAFWFGRCWRFAEAASLPANPPAPTSNSSRRRCATSSRFTV